MTLRELLEHMDTLRPSAYTPAQKTAWVSDLEAVVWTQILLQPMGLWRRCDADEDAEARLLLPEGWRRVYTSYLDAMIDLANGEYDQYQNSMSLYNSCIAELGAWYAELYEPAMRPAQWTGGAACAYTDLTGEARHVCALPADEALLALEWRVTEPFDGSGVLRMSTESGEKLAEVDIINGKTDAHLIRGLVLPEQGRQRLCISYAGDDIGHGTGRIRLLSQPPARKGNKFT